MEIADVGCQNTVRDFQWDTHALAKGLDEGNHVFQADALQDSGCPVLSAETGRERRDVQAEQEQHADQRNLRTQTRATVSETPVSLAGPWAEPKMLHSTHTNKIPFTWSSRSRLIQIVLYKSDSAEMRAWMNLGGKFLECTQSISFLVHSNWDTGASERQSRAARLLRSLQSRARSRLSLTLVSQLLWTRKERDCV